MRITFYTLEKKKTSPRGTVSVARGGFGTAVGLILGGEGGGRKGRRIADRAAVIEQVHKPKMSEEEVKEANVSEFGKMQHRIATMNEVMNAVEVNGTAVKQLKNMVKDLKSTVELFQAAFRAQHGEDPMPAEEMARVDEEVLSQHYVSYVLASKNPEPKQSQLAAHSKVSQSTWSRAFKELKFWEGVNKRTEAVWTAHSVVQKTIEKLKAFDVADHEVHLDQQELQDIPDPFVTDVEFKADMDKYTSWGKQKLIREILRRVPSLRAMELDPKPLETLAKILVAFS
jgi:hypothetical protein